MQIALGIVFLVGGLLVINWLIHLLFRPIPRKAPDDDADGSGAAEGS